MIPPAILNLILRYIPKRAGGKIEQGLKQALLSHECHALERPAFIIALDDKQEAVILTLAILGPQGETRELRYPHQVGPLVDLVIQDPERNGRRILEQYDKTPKT